MDGNRGPTGAPPPPPSRTPSRSARYAYLVARLRQRQITMEEATELFELQQSTIAAALAQVPPPPADVDASGTPAEPPPTAPPSSTGVLASDDALWLGLLAGGVGAGLLAAVLRRASEGPRPGAERPVPRTPP